MGVVIAATAAVHTSDGYIADASAAIASALDLCGIAPDKVHALINTGLYRESNIVEPAVSALISKKAEIGLEYTTGAVPTFTFDLMNGSCGILNAIQIAAALLTTDSASNVVVSSGDEHPSGQFDASFPYTCTAAAMVLTLEDGDAGFGSLAVQSLTGTIPADGYLDLSSMGNNGRNSLTLEPKTDFEDAVGLAVSVGRQVLHESNLDPDRTLLVAGRPFPDFAAKVAAQLGIQGSAVVTPPGEGDPHTSAITLAYRSAVEQGMLSNIDHVLFLAGGGLTAAAMPYRCVPA